MEDVLIQNATFTNIPCKILFDKTRNILTNWYFIRHIGGLLQNGTWSTLAGNLLTFHFRCQSRNFGFQKARNQSIQQRGGHLLTQSRIWSTFDTGSETSTSFPPKWIKYHSEEVLRRVGWNINLWFVSIFLVLSNIMLPIWLSTKPLESLHWANYMKEKKLQTISTHP